MPPKKPLKSNKTAHVLNLLTNVKDSSDPGAPEEASSTPNRPLVPPLVEMAQSTETALSDTIRDALEEVAPVEAAPVEAAPVEAAPVEAAPVAAAPEEAAPVKAAPVAAAPVEVSPVEAAPVEPISSDDGRDIIYVDVMREMVEAQTDKYMKMFGLCTCPRCVVDVKALALCNLPSKYVVIRKREEIPLLTIYEGQ